LRQVQIPTEYFIDEEKYSGFILLHINTVVIVGSFAAIAMGTLIFAYLQHTCAMFKIAWYEIVYKYYVKIKETMFIDLKLLPKQYILKTI
jgi:hypothetical protein